MHVKMKLPRKPRNARQEPPRVPGGPPDATPSPRIWVHPHNQSLQPLYLHYVTMLHMEITLQIYRMVGEAALPPRELRGPPPLSPVHALPQCLWQPWHLWG